MNNTKDSLINDFQRLPGIGPKQAERFAYYLMKQNKAFIESLSKNILNIKLNSSQCTECFSFFANNINKTTICNICADESRNKSIMLIVEKELDVNAIEKTSEYNGVYFVTGGKLPFLVDDPREYIRIRELVDIIRKKLDVDDSENLEKNEESGNKKESKKLKEIIFALPANDEGDNQVEYIKKTINQIVGMQDVKISILARGVSTGLEMEYIDHDTFKSAFSFRK
jgi:recombination protein RecR